MAAQPSTIEFYERQPLMEFVIGARRFVPKIPINLKVDYNEGLWIVSLPFLDAVGSCIDYHEAKLIFDVLWCGYVSCPEEELGETSRMQKDLLQGMFKVC